VESIRGASLPDEWPTGAMPPGTRVRVIQDQDWPGPWQQVFAGTISGMAAPETPMGAGVRPGELAYWVEFDKPQRDADGDGPYRKAHIWDRYLEAI
jgi:hypothetical protein